MPAMVSEKNTIVEYVYSNFEYSFYSAGNGAIIEYSVDGKNGSQTYYNILDIEAVKNTSVAEPRIILRKTDYNEGTMDFWCLWWRDKVKTTYKPVVVAESFEAAHKWIDEQVGN